MSARARLYGKRKESPVTFEGDFDGNQQNPVLSAPPSSPSTPGPPPANVAQGFDLMDGFLNNSLSAATTREYQVCTQDFFSPSFLLNNYLR